VDKQNKIKNKLNKKDESNVLILEKKNHDANFKSTLKNSMEFGHKMMVSSCETPNMVLGSLLATGIDTSFSRPVQMFREKIQIDTNFDL